MTIKKSYIQIKISLEDENSCEECKFYSSTPPTFCGLFLVRNIETRLPLCKHIEDRLMSSLEIQKSTRVLLFKINNYSEYHDYCSGDCTRHGNNGKFMTCGSMSRYPNLCAIFKKELKSVFSDRYNYPFAFERYQECLNAEI